MDHYVIFILENGFSEDDEILIKKYLDYLFPTNLEYQHILHINSQVAFLLKPVLKYIAVLNKVKISEHTEWKDLSEDLNIKDIISKEDMSEKSMKDFILKDFIQQISVSLHSLADQLPAFGTYKLDVVLESNIFKNLTFSEEPVLASAFYRLLKWHSCNFTILLREELNNDNLTEWYEFMNAHTVQISNVKKFGPPLWRGSIQLESLDTPENVLCQGFSLNLDRDENIYLESPSFKDSSPDSKYVIEASKLHLVDQCKFSTIPSYLISPVVFKLNFNQSKFSNEKSVLMDYLSNEKEEAIILRLNYSWIKEKPKQDKKYNFSRWAKVVSSGCIKDADVSMPTFNESIVFAVTKSRQSNNIIAFPFRDPSSLNVDFYYNFVNLKSSDLSSQICIEKEMNPVCDLKQELYFIQSSYLNKIIPKLLHMKMDLYKKGNFNSFECVSTLWENIRSVKYSLADVKASDAHYEGIDPSDWPERIYLLNKQMQSDKEEKCFSLDVMQSRLGQRKSQQSIPFPAEDIWEFFLPSGENKNSNTGSIHSLGNLSRHMIYDLNTVCNMEWPEVLNYTYHDLYYNFGNQAEKREAGGTKMINCYVHLETTSIYNIQKSLQDFSIIIPERNSETKSQKQFRSPSYRKVQRTKRQGVKRKSNDSVEDLMTDLVTKKILYTSCSENRHKEGKYKKDIITNTYRIKLKRKEEVPVRCSPRKKKPVSYKYAAYNGSSNSNKSVIKSNKSSELSDLIRRKLRNAVGIALENNGINLSDAFFQPCGKRLFTICKAFVQDISQKEGKISDFLQKIADAHVKQVIEFERQNLNVK